MALRIRFEPEVGEEIVVCREPQPGAQGLPTKGASITVRRYEWSDVSRTSSRLFTKWYPEAKVAAALARVKARFPEARERGY